MLRGDFGRERERGLACRAALGVDKNHTVGTARTIDGSSRSVLEHLDALDVGRCDIKKCAKVFGRCGREAETLGDVRRVRYTVDYDERVAVVVKRADTAYLDGVLGTRVTADTYVKT